MTGLGGQSDTYVWSAPSGGRPFLNYVASLSSAVFTEYANPATNSSSMSCYFGKPEESATIRCTYHSSQYNVDVPLQKTIKVVGPQRDEKRHDIYQLQLLKGASSDIEWTSGSPYPNAYMLWGAVYNDPEHGISIWGMYQVDTLRDPGHLSPGSGTWGYVQTKDRRSYLFDVEIEHSTGLDGGFPYPDYTNSDGWISADGDTRRRFRDKPGAADITQVFPLDLRYEGNYDLYIFYKPTDSAAGSSVYVPVRFIPWAAKGECAAQTYSGSWTQQDLGSGWRSGATDYPTTFPQW